MKDLQDVVLPDGLVGEGEHPDGKVPGDGGEAHVGHTADGGTCLLICYLHLAKMLSNDCKHVKSFKRNK